MNRYGGKLGLFPVLWLARPVRSEIAIYGTDALFAKVSAVQFQSVEEEGERREGGDGLAGLCSGPKGGATKKRRGEERKIDMQCRNVPIRSANSLSRKFSVSSNACVANIPNRREREQPYVLAISESIL